MTPSVRRPPPGPRPGRTALAALTLLAVWFCLGCGRPAGPHDGGRPVAPPVAGDNEPRPRATWDSGLRPLPRPLAPAGAAPGLGIRLHGKDDPTVDVVGLTPEELAAAAALTDKPERWASVFAVYVDRPAGKGRGPQLPMLGSYRVEDGVVRFRPRFPLEPGVRYRATFGLPARTGPRPRTVEVVLSRPKAKPARATVVEHVYPSADRLPENQLKFYLHFSAPMSRGEAYEHLRLIDPRGRAVDLPFLELEQELWDPSGRRFTLFFDPGRIKRGLKPREEVGPALEEGKRYTLVIDRGWSDAEGNPLKETHRKTFTVAAPDDTPPDPRTWKLVAPAAGSTGPLTVTFPKPMDHALLERLLTVSTDKGRALVGKVGVTDEETRWRFTPREAWAAGTYRLVIDTRLEDLAGNSIGRPFEVDVFRRVQREVKGETVTVPFDVRPNTPK